MGTKWKNIDKKITIFLKNERGWQVVAGSLLALAGIAFYTYTIGELRRYFDDMLFIYGSLAITSLTIGVIYILRFILNRKYENWLPENEDFYKNWKKQCRKQQFILFSSIVIITFILTLFIYYTIWFYATGWFMLFAAFIQYISCEIVIISYMGKKLDLLMECMAGIKQEHVEVAIRSEKMKVDLISNVSHDLKTPLTSMVGYIDLMKKEELGDSLKDYVEVLSAKAEKLKEMIESLFSLAKTSSGNIELKPEPINMNRLAEQVYADMEDQIMASGLEFVTELTAQDTGIIADSSYMYRICQNLMENALKYSAKDTRVFLKTSVDKGELPQTVQLEITNTSNYRMNFTKDQIIARFSRGDESRTSEGNGLGLAIVNTYTSALGGKFDVTIDCDQFKAMVTFGKK